MIRRLLDQALSGALGRGIIACDSWAWLVEQRTDGHPWVFPSLERAYLRHAAGLGMIRRLLDQALSGALGRGIIACDSWAWAFLQHVWAARPAVTLTLQAFDQVRLETYIQRLMDSSYTSQLRFRQSDNGQYVVPPLDADHDSNETSDFLRLLAAHSRGILGLAWEVWRASLRTEPDEALPEEAQEQERAIPGRTVWVTPWGQSEQPSLPASAGHHEAFVLHALLFHNGLPLDLLGELLPLSPGQVTETLCRLEAGRLVASQNGLWWVSPLGYPAVRQFLEANGYLVDQL
jgi:hypothetical protein